MTSYYKKKCNHSQYYYNYSYVTRLESKLALEKRAIYRCMFTVPSSQLSDHPVASRKYGNEGFVANLVM
jgi:hypothetical protein